MKYLAITFVVLMLGGCVDTKEEKFVNGRYTLTASSTTNTVYRLDTVTGSLHFCRVVGIEPNYQLICIPETR